MQYLQDANCEKQFPTAVNRDWTCAIPVLDSAPNGYCVDATLVEAAVDVNTLGASITDTDVNLCVIVTKRVNDRSAPSGVRLYNKYLCAGDRSAMVPYETWSR
jgi:hypothetical protein